MKTFLFLVKSPPPSSPFPAPQLEATGKSNEQNRLFSGSSQSSRGTPGNAGGRHAQRTEQSRGTAPRGRAGGAPERSLNSRQRARGGGGGGSSAKTPRQGLAGVGRTARAPWLSRPRRALSTQKRSGRKRHCSTEAEERMLVWETNRPGSSCGLPGARWERPAQGRVKEAPCRPVARACGPIGGEASEEDGTRNRDAAAGTSNGQN